METPRKNRREKFLINLGFGAKGVRKTGPNSEVLHRLRLQARLEGTFFNGSAGCPSLKTCIQLRQRSRGAKSIWNAGHIGHLCWDLEYVNGDFQTGFLYFRFGGGLEGGGWRGVGEGLGWGRVGDGLGGGLGRGWGRVGAGLDFSTSETPLEKPR